MKLQIVYRNSPDHCVEVKVEARREPTPQLNGNSLTNGTGAGGIGDGTKDTPLVYF